MEKLKTQKTQKKENFPQMGLSQKSHKKEVNPHRETTQKQSFCKKFLS